MPLYFDNTGFDTFVLDGFDEPSFFSGGLPPIPPFPPLPPVPPNFLPDPNHVASNYNTADRVIRQAMRNARILEKGGDPTPEDYAEYLPMLNDMVNFWQTQGIKLWLNEIINIALTAGQSRYTIGPGRALRVLEAYYVQPRYTVPGGVTYATSTPLNALAWMDYNRLGTTAQQGTPNSYFTDKQQQGAEVVLWPVPSAQVVPGVGAYVPGFLQVLAQMSPGNMIRITDRVVFPQEWYIALNWGLADELASGQSDATIQRCKQKADYYRMQLENWDVEDAPVVFAVNTQGRSPRRFGR